MKQRNGLLPRGLLVGGLSLMLAGPSSAQMSAPRPGDMVAGDSVRVRATGTQRVEATVIGWQGSTLLLSVPGLEQAWSLPIHQIQAMDRYQARSPRDGFRNGVVMGMVTGVFLGAAVGLALYTSGVTKDEDGPPAEQLISSVLRYSGLFTVGGGLTWGFLKAKNPGRGWVGVSFTTR